MLLIRATVLAQSRRLFPVLRAVPINRHISLVACRYGITVEAPGVADCRQSVGSFHRWDHLGAVL